MSAARKRPALELHHQPVYFVTAEVPGHYCRDCAAIMMGPHLEQPKAKIRRLRPDIGEEHFDDLGGRVIDDILGRGWPRISPHPPDEEP